MDIFTLIFLIIAVGLTVASTIKNKKKTFAAMKKSKSMMGNMMGEIIAIIFLPEYYEIKNNKAYIKALPDHKEAFRDVMKSAQKCPTKAIIFEKAIEGEIS